MNINALLPKIVVVIFGIIAIIGAKFVITGLLPYPSKKARKTVKVYEAKNKRAETSSGSMSDTVKNVTRPLSRFVRLTPIAKDEMGKALQISGINMTPEEYTAFCYGYACLFIGAGLVLLLIGAIMKMNMYLYVGAIVACAGPVMAFVKKRSLTKTQKEAIAGVDGELSRFVSFIRSAMATGNESILSMVERYTAYDEHFGEELARTIADAKTSNFEAAMARFDQRMNSDKLKMVIHGLVAANNGDNVDVYFSMLERDFEAYEIALLKQNVKTIPKRMRLPKMLMYSAVAFTLFLPIIMQIIDSFKGIFG